MENAGLQSAETEVSAAQLDIPLERDVFLRNLVRYLAGVLEGIVGLKEASGFISLVGEKMGELLNVQYKTAYGVSTLTSRQVADVLVDLKARIKGEFKLVEMDDEKMVFRNTACPFAEKVIGRPSMCMMTSNVFGHIAAENLGYAKVELRETIARSQPECKVVVHLEQTEAAQSCDGREYYRSADA